MLPIIPNQASPSWIQFPILVEDKLGFYKHMQQNHIDVTWTYRYSCPDSYGKKNYPNSHKAAKTVIGLPTYPMLTGAQVLSIISAARKFNNDLEGV